MKVDEPMRINEIRDFVKVVFHDLALTTKKCCNILISLNALEQKREFVCFPFNVSSTV
jgi:hypothetical protein